MTTLARIDAALHSSPLGAGWTCYHDVPAETVDEVARAARRRGWAVKDNRHGALDRSITVTIPARFPDVPGAALGHYDVTLWEVPA